MLTSTPSGKGDTEGANKLLEVLPDLGEDLHKRGEGAGRKREKDVFNILNGYLDIHVQDGEIAGDTGSIVCDDDYVRGGNASASCSLVDGNLTWLLEDEQVRCVRAHWKSPETSVRDGNYYFPIDMDIVKHGLRACASVTTEKKLRNKHRLVFALQVEVENIRFSAARAWSDMETQNLHFGYRMSLADDTLFSAVELPDLLMELDETGNICIDLDILTHEYTVSRIGGRKILAIMPDIVINYASTQQIIMVELTVLYENRMEEAHSFKEGKCHDLTKELKKDGYEAKVMPVEIGARGFVGSSAYGLLSKLSICGNKRTKALRLLAKTAENSSRWIWSRRNERLLHKDYKYPYDTASSWPKRLDAGFVTRCTQSTQE
ncbi:reverse transcriptase [Plakobranchus ocellatus]|uniref:Reverse transcriptase n=1 Tax=Plakobranchus ocellatus TaxID=259542 RepID=A0AAV3XTL7_9GAST|nr:reverse transcriptase [Plakobranchus ocellatus]